MTAPALLPLSQVIDQHGLRAKKSLGQHFLLDTNLLAKIVRAAGDISDMQVVEVGPGNVLQGLFKKVSKEVETVAG